MVKNKNNMGVRILADGVTVDNNSMITKLNNNDLIVGSSSSGKTGGYVIPNIQHISGSMIISDTKNQLHRRFAKSLAQKGYEVKVIDFVNMNKSCCYNPLANIRRNKKGRFCEQDILTLSNALIKVTAEDKEPIWHLRISVSDI